MKEAVQFGQPRCLLEYILDIVDLHLLVLIDRNGYKVKLNVVPYVVNGAVGHGTTTQRANLLLVDTVVGRLPATLFAGLHLHEVHGVVVLGNDIYLVGTHSPVSLHDVVSSAAQPLLGDILTMTAYYGLSGGHYLVRLMRNSMLSPGLTS